MATLLDGAKMAELLSKAKLSVFRKLRLKKNRDSEKRFLIEGWHLLDEALKAGINPRAVIYEDTRPIGGFDQTVFGAARERAESVYEATESQLKALAETKTSPGVIGVLDCLPDNWLSLQKSIAAKRSGFIVAMDGVSDPGNCGSIIRGASWFGADAVLLGEGCPERENGKLVRATMGGLFHLPICSIANWGDTLSTLKRENFEIVASALGAPTLLDSFVWPPKAVLLVGNEARGVSADILKIADHTIEIPRFGQVESLNAAMATSILLAHWRIH